MKITLTKILTVFIFLFSFENYSQNAINTKEVKILLGEWTGTLTYIDYSSNDAYTMPANLSVKQGKNENQLLLFNIYPKEPKANSKDKIKISKNGQLLNGKAVKSNRKLSNGQTQITTEYSGKDNSKNALIRNVYIFGENQFVIRKEVKFENSDKWLVRNEYNYAR